LLNDSGATTQQWKMIDMVTTNGVTRYQIKPRSSEELDTNWCIGVGSSRVDGAEIMQKAYNIEVCLWTFEPTTIAYNLNLNVFYDHAYNEKFPNAQARILGHLEDARAYYYSNFGIYINYTKPQMFESTADVCDAEICDCKNNQDSQDSNNCLHPGEFINNWGTLRGTDIHCHNLAFMTYSQVDILKDNYSLYVQNAATVVFSGHEDTCMNDEDGKHTTGNSGVFFPDINAFIVNVQELSENQINRVNFTDDELAHIHASAAQSAEQVMLEAKKQKLEKFILMHEFGHLYNPGTNLDHYKEGHTELLNNFYNTDDFNDNCTYGQNGEQLLQFTICDGCKDRMDNQFNDYNHSLMEVP